ncbi:hypothetical protein GOBAR_AA05471 [Gossypium barbadense]|uniref:(+)-neomenthol dehydrogenase n=1 Tax=Gossypium barbadense TaxID=3634 RepID=A0A2P5YHQ3_GOSBA|nr:hypothetical protein GOBAR_AA05471 [Gossypium barbadense]
MLSFQFSEQILLNFLLRFVVVTGTNRGIGLEICKLMALKGTTVVLIARDVKRVLEAIDKLKDLGLSDNVNNAGIGGVKGYFEALRDAGFGKPGAQPNQGSLLTQSLELFEQRLQTNYYGVKRMSKSFIHLLPLSDSLGIINVSSSMENDAKNLTEDKVDEILSKSMKDFKEGSLQEKGWPIFMSAYILSKATMNAYTRILANKNPNFIINCVFPGFLKTDINFNSWILSVEEGAESLVRLSLLPNNGPSSLFFVRKEERISIKYCLIQKS